MHGLYLEEMNASDGLGSRMAITNAPISFRVSE